MAKRKIISFCLVTVFFLNVFIGVVNNSPILCNQFVGIYPVSIPNLVELSDGDQDIPYFFLNTEILEESYQFLANGSCVLGVELAGTDLSRIFLDGEDYKISYGFNNFPLEFGEVPEVHSITIEASELVYIEHIYVQPLIFIDETFNLEAENKTVSFEAGGDISILVRTVLPFTFNDLILEFDDKLVKPIYKAEEVNELEIIQFSRESLTTETGQFFKYSFHVDPGLHELTLNGTGYLDYYIISEFDFDYDLIETSEEINLQAEYGFRPDVPDLYGWYESGYYYDYRFQNGSQVIFDFYNPADSGYLYIDVYEGSICEITVDEDSNTMKDIILDSSQEPFIKELGRGFHQIFYKVLNEEGGLNHIRIRMNQENIPIRDISHFLDLDCDGVKDMIEWQDGLNSLSSDTDDDGLPDGYDQSPLNKIVLKKDNIMQYLLPIRSDRTSILNIHMKKPENDFSCTSRLWRDTLNLSILPLIRIFGNQTISELTFEFEKSMDLINILPEDSNYDPSGTGDALPASEPNQVNIVVPLIPSIQCWEVNLIYEPLHPAKTDGILDLRFDLVWGVYSYDSVDKAYDLIHYYPFEEDIIIQSINLADISDVRYTLASPSSVIENKIFHAITENPNLGEFQDYGVQDKLIGNSLEPFNNILTLIEEISGYYESLEIFPYEVLYMVGKSNYFNPMGENKYEITFSTYMMISPSSSASDIIDAVEQARYVEFRSGEAQDFSQVINNGIIDLKLTTYDAKNILEMKKITGRFESYLDYTDIDLDVLPIGVKIIDDIISEDRFKDGSLQFDENSDAVKTSIKNRFMDISIDEKLRDNTLRLSAFDTYFSETRDLLGELVTDLSQYIETTEDLLSFLENKGFQVHPFWELSADLTTSIELRDLLVNKRQQYESEFGPLSLKASPSDYQLFGGAFYETSKIKNNVKLFLEDELIKVQLSDLVNAEELMWFLEQVQNLIFQSITIQDSVEELAKTYSAIHGIMSSIKEDVTYISYSFSSQSGNSDFSVNGYAYVFLGPFAIIGLGTVVVSLTASFSAIGVGIVKIIYDIIEIIEMVKDQLDETTQINEQAFLDKLTSAVLSIVATSSLVLQGFVILFNLIGVMSDLTFDLVSSFLSSVCIAATAMAAIYDMLALVIQVYAGDFSLRGFEFLIEILKVVASFGRLAVVIIVALAISSTGYGALFSAALVATELVMMGFNLLLHQPNLIPKGTYIYPSKQNWVVNETVTFTFEYENTGNTNFYFYGSVAAGGPTVNEDEWGPLVFSWILMNDIFMTGSRKTNISISTVIKEAAAKLYLHYRYTIYTTTIEIIPYSPIPIVFYPSLYAQDEQSEYIGTAELSVSALEAKVSEVYSNTVPIEGSETSVVVGSFAALQKAIEEYRYKDAKLSGQKIINIRERDAGITINKYLGLQTTDFNDSHLVLNILEEDEFKTTINSYFDLGWRARVLGEYTPITSQSDDSDEIELDAELIELMRNLNGFQGSSGDIVIPKDWFEGAEQKIDDAVTAKQMIDELPCEANLLLDLREENFEIDPTTMQAKFNLKFVRDGPNIPNLDLEIVPPDGFSFSPETRVMNSYDVIPVSISQINPGLLAGIYYFDINLYLDGTLIFQKQLFVRVLRYYDVHLETTTVTPSVEPGSTLELEWSIENEGSLPIYAEFVIYSDNETFNEWVTYTNPGPKYYPPYDPIHTFEVAPPRHFSTDPGIYNLTVAVYDAMDLDNEYDAIDPDKVYGYINYKIYVREFREAEIIGVQQDPVPTCRPGEGVPISREIEINNKGNVPLYLSLRCEIPPYSHEYFPTPSIFLINRGEVKLSNFEFTVEQVPLISPGVHTMTCGLYYGRQYLDFASFPVEILEFHEYDFSVPEHFTFNDDEQGLVPISVQNLGNVPDSFTVEVDYEGTVLEEIYLSKSETEVLNPLESEEITLYLQPAIHEGHGVITVTFTGIDHIGEPMVKEYEFTFTVVDDDPDPAEITWSDPGPNMVHVIKYPWQWWIREWTLYDEVTITDEEAFHNPVSYTWEIHDVGSGIWTYSIYLDDVLIESQMVDQTGNEIAPISGTVEILNVIDDPATPDVDEGLHSLRVEVWDNDFDNEDDLDRILQTRAIFCRIVDDDTTPPELIIGTLDFVSGEDYLFNTFSSINETSQVFHDNENPNRAVLVWQELDASGISYSYVLHKVLDFDNETILLEEYPIYVATKEEPIAFKKLFNIPLIPGIHVFNITGADMDVDRDDDSSVASKLYYITIYDDDVTPLVLEDLAVLKTENGFLEIRATTTDPGFYNDPTSHKLFLFVDGSFIEDVDFSFLKGEESRTEILGVTENLWTGEGGTHEVELLSVDDDDDYLPNPRGKYDDWDYVTYHASSILQFGTGSINIFYDFAPDDFISVYDSPIDYVILQNMLPFIPEVIGGYALPHTGMDWFMNPVNSTFIMGDVIIAENTSWTGLLDDPRYINPYFTAIKPGAIHYMTDLFRVFTLMRLFEVLDLQGVSIEEEAIAKGVDLGSMVSLTRTWMDVSLPSGVVQRQVFVFEMNPQLIFFSPTYLTPSGECSLNEYIKFVYDAETGILINHLTKHLPDPSDPNDEEILYMDVTLFDTNAFRPYEFSYKDQTINAFVSPDAALYAVSTTFWTPVEIAIEASITPPELNILDSELAEFTLTLANRGNIQDTFRVTPQITSCDWILTRDGVPISSDVNLAKNEVVELILILDPFVQGSEEFSVDVLSLGSLEYSNEPISETLQGRITILDDDPHPPLVDLNILNVDRTMITVHVQVSDESGVSWKLAIDGSEVLTGTGNTDQTFNFPNLWFDLLTHEMELTAWDLDQDVPGDSLQNSISLTFEITAIGMLEFIQQELETLKVEVLDNVDEPFNQIIARQLDKSLEKIALALVELLEGNLPRSVFLDRLSKINLDVAGILTIIGEKIERIDETFAKYLISELHRVRDLITLAMGASIGSSAALAIADVEVQINGLADDIYEEMSILKAILIDINLWQACDKLDKGLVWLASECVDKAVKKVSGAIRDLEQTKDMVSLLQWFGCISDEDAAVIKTKLDAFIGVLEAIKTDLQG